jgi:hypothetical protein
MNYKRILCYFSLLLAVAFLMPCSGWSQPLGGGPPRPGTKPPVITNAFAIEKGYFGYAWKIYIEAEDPDGDMLRIASVADQPGYGRYPTDFIYLKRQNQNRFRGYIQWNTYSTKTNFLREWTPITLSVSVLDKAGNESNVVVFPFLFVSGSVAPYKPPAPFDQADLPKIGNISIDLYEPTMMGNARDD